MRATRDNLCHRGLAETLQGFKAKNCSYECPRIIEVKASKALSNISGLEWWYNANSPPWFHFLLFL